MFLTAASRSGKKRELLLWQCHAVCYSARADSLRSHGEDKELTEGYVKDLWENY